ncbi:hypothetical protein M422DRAFT_27937 [Sphaerobolus stellatus SS14]|nr:hypothetical protein M422DRAFT_27937 [Sphaerobolus stellatus SS14]
MATWLHYPASHPWMPTLKRKHSPDDSSESDSPQQFASRPSRPLPHQPKRRRYDISRNLSRLSLIEQIQTQPVIQEPSYEDFRPGGEYMGHDDLDIRSWSPPSQQEDTYSQSTMDTDVPLYAGARPVVEEPTEKNPAIPEIHMHHSSSYEPEKDRIVVTDLDSSEDESETNESSANDGFTVSPAYLAHINATKSTPPILKPVIPQPDAGDSRALVLFRPPPWTPPSQQLGESYTSDNNNTQDIEVEPSTPQVVESDPDAMDIE